MNEDRLIRAIKLLQDLPPERFDMGNWGWNEEVSSDMTETDLRQGCGTTACAFGWIASTKEARAAGLRLVLTRNSADGFYEVEYRPFKNKMLTETGIDAARLYFGFEFKATAMYLFTAPHYVVKSYSITPAMVAARMQIVLDKGEAAFIADKRANDLAAIPASELVPA